MSLKEIKLHHELMTLDLLPKLQRHPVKGTAGTMGMTLRLLSQK